MAWQDDGSRRLDALLKKARITSTRLAAKLGVDRSLVSRWRSGERVPDADDLARILGELDGSGLADYVLGLTPLDPLAVEQLRRDVARLVEVARTAGGGEKTAR